MLQIINCLATSSFSFYTEQTPLPHEQLQLKLWNRSDQSLGQYTELKSEMQNQIKASRKYFFNPLAAKHFAETSPERCSHIWFLNELTRQHMEYLKRHLLGGSLTWSWRGRIGWCFLIAAPASGDPEPDKNKSVRIISTTCTNANLT